MIVCLQWDFLQHAVLFSLVTVGTVVVAHWAPTPNALSIFVVLSKVLIKLFQKFAQSRARSPCRSRRSETPFTALFFLLAFSFGPFASKEKAENDLDERYGYG